MPAPFLIHGAVDSEVGVLAGFFSAEGFSPSEARQRLIRDFLDHLKMAAILALIFAEAASLHHRLGGKGPAPINCL
jgi:hypothetical protein